METIKANTLIQSLSESHSWFGVKYNVNIYKGCNQGCIYCDSRSECYQIRDFDTVKVKENADVKIEKELSSKRIKGVVSLGGMNDPYNKFEKDMEYTKRVLTSINKHKFGVFIVTKSDLVLRDIDILKSIKLHSVVNVGITITTYNDALQGRIERNVSSTSERFEALKKLRDANIFCGIMMMPILPFINDTVDNVRSIVEKAHEYNLNYIYPSFGVTLRGRQREHFYGKIGKELTKKYRDTFGDSYMCSSPNSNELQSEFIRLCEKYGILYKMKDIIEASKKHIVEQQIQFEI